MGTGLLGSALLIRKPPFLSSFLIVFLVFPLDFCYSISSEIFLVFYCLASVPGELGSSELNFSVGSNCLPPLYLTSFSPLNLAAKSP